MPDWLHIIIRSLTTLITLFLITRILGKKQISQLTFFEYVVGITLGDLAGVISTDVQANFTHGMLALGVWFIVPLGLEILALKSKMLRDLFEGKGTVLIKDGSILEDNLKKERYSVDELLEQLRTKSVFKLADVEFAMLEATGDLSVLLKSENQPITPKHLGMKLPTEKPPQAVIMDGEIQLEGLAALRKNIEWLNMELGKLGVMQENVFLGQVDGFSQMKVDLYDDKIKLPAPHEKPMLLATLKKCEADLQLFSLITKHVQAKQMYEQCAMDLKQIIAELEPILKTLSFDLNT
jgi:uncharacterized membrane protein YcaP (DUF421 family)